MIFKSDKGQAGWGLQRPQFLSSVKLISKCLYSQSVMKEEEDGRTWQAFNFHTSVPPLLIPVNNLCNFDIWEKEFNLGIREV